MAILDKGIENTVTPKELNVVAHWALLYSILKSFINYGIPIDNNYKSNAINAIPITYKGIIKPYLVYLSYSFLIFLLC